MKKNTKEDLLRYGQARFAQNGFYGTSINDIAKEVGVSKQALLHHFPSKEKLYAQVMERAALYLVGFIEQIKSQTPQPKQQLILVFHTLSSATDEQLEVIILLLRELLDNRERAKHAHKWYLRPFLDALMDMVEQGQQQGDINPISPLALTYHLLGATQYYVVSLPTLAEICSEEEFAVHQQTHLALIESVLSSSVCNCAQAHIKRL